MAHFAELESKIDPTGFTSDTHKIVVSVTVVGNDIPANGGILENNDMHIDGELWCKNFFNKPNTEFKQTSYNHSFRKQYAGIGFRYDSDKDIFIMPQPFASWSLDDNNDWQPPIANPTVTDDGQDPTVWWYNISWNETKYNADNTKGWEATKSNDEAETPTVYDWNGTAWVSA
mgnify:FL=1|tara:strand:- start:201 stop:719 length:519 start_codon:yes stop_codon:yes gene_type:complete